MMMRGRPRPMIAAIAVAALLAGAVVGWLVKPLPPVPRTSPPELGADVLATIDDLEKRSGALVEILNDMVAGRVSRDPGALEAVRDSMQEITADLGDVKSQLRVLQQPQP